jgi:hypothetical protein
MRTTGGAVIALRHLALSEASVRGVCVVSARNTQLTRGGGGDDGASWVTPRARWVTLREITGGRCRVRVHG